MNYVDGFVGWKSPARIRRHRLQGVASATTSRPASSRRSHRVPVPKKNLLPSAKPPASMQRAACAGAT